MCVTVDKLVADKVQRDVDALQKSIADKQSELMAEKKLATQVSEQLVYVDCCLYNNNNNGYTRWTCTVNHECCVVCNVETVDESDAQEGGQDQTETYRTGNRTRFLLAIALIFVGLV